MGPDPSDGDHLVGRCLCPGKGKSLRPGAGHLKRPELKKQNMTGTFRVRPRHGSRPIRFVSVRAR